MGFLDKLTRAGSTELSLTVDPDRVPAGGEVRVHWDVGGEIDDKDRAIRAGVTATGFYLARDRDDPDPADRRDVEQRSFTVWEATHEGEVVLGPGEAVFQLPADAPPGSADVLKWTAWARIDRKGGRDDAEEVTIYVRRPEVESGPEEVSNDGFVVSGIPRAVRLNRTYEGHVTFTPDSDVSGSVKARLIRRCRYDSHENALGGLPDLLGMPQLPGIDTLSKLSGSGSVVEREETEAEVELAGKADYAAGQSTSFALSLPVPKKGPTTAHAHATVDWRLEVVLDRRMRGDLSVVQALEVS